MMILVSAYRTKLIHSNDHRIERDHTYRNLCLYKFKRIIKLKSSWALLNDS